MFKKFAIAIMVFFGVSLAAQAADLKIGVVNVQQLMAESPQGKKVMDELKKEFEPRRQKLEAKGKQGQELQQKLQRNGSVMSDAERQDSQKKLRDLKRELQVEGQSFQEDLQSARQDKVGKLQQEIGTQIQKYARDHKFDLIIPTNAAVYAGPSIDVTDAVMKELKAADK